MNYKIIINFFITIFLFFFNKIIAEPSFSQQQYTSAIEDNSMFIEEAYNQEDGIIQHISNFIFTPSVHSDFMFLFTQEIPLFSNMHQLSYSLPLISSAMNAKSGIGDIMLNYRFQLFNKEHWAAVAPRLSIIFPTGNKTSGFGDGYYGLQLNLPASRRWSEYIVTHLNLGLTYYFVQDYKNINYYKNLQNFFTGISLIYLVSENFNLIAEAYSSFNADNDSPDSYNFKAETIIAPGFRNAINIGELQIVTGLAVPLTLMSDNSNIYAGLFFYLSFEHTF